jgi:putative flippase GtrA
MYIERFILEEENKTLTLKEKFKAFIERNKGVWQLIKFTFASMASGLTEFILFIILAESLKSVNTPIPWFIFDNYTKENGGVGKFVAFLLSTSLAQVVAFLINRKKTFNSNSNLAFSISATAVMVTIIILLNTWLAPMLSSSISSGTHSEFLETYLTKIVLMLMTFVIVFLSSKFVIMRQVKPKEQVAEQAPSPLNAQSAATAEALAAKDDSKEG